MMCMFHRFFVIGHYAMGCPTCYTNRKELDDVVQCYVVGYALFIQAEIAGEVVKYVAENAKGVAPGQVWIFMCSVHFIKHCTRTLCTV